MNKLKMFAGVSSAALALIAVAPAQAQIDAPVPAANYITIDGLDWAWAAPCAAYGDSCGVIDMSYQSTQGWRFPTLEEFLARPKVSDFGTESNFACASAWFSTAHSHCDYSNPELDGGVNAQGQAMGYLFDFGYGITNHGLDYYSETWVVRGNISPAVPEPASWALMIGGLGIVGGAMRRRTAAVSFA